MLELLLQKPPGNLNFYPNSGPGTKTLQFGTQTLGYFGEVSGAELFYGTDLIGKFNIAVGTPSTWVGSQWFKFFRNGKVIYISRQQVISGIAWNDLYNLGLVYGVKGNGLYPAGAGVEQWNPIQKFDGTRNWYLKPRLMTGIGVDPATGAVSDGGEWNQLFGRVVTGTNTGVADKWATLATTYVGYGGTGQLSSLVQETYTSDVTRCWNRGVADDLTAVSNIPKSGGFQWRPVLELIPDTQLLDPYAVSALPVVLQAPAIVDARNNVSGAGAVAPLLDPANVITLWPTKQPVITNFAFTGAALDPVNVAVSGSVSLNAFTIAATPSQLAYDPANLTYSLADLNPFAISGSTT